VVRGAGRWDLEGKEEGCYNDQCAAPGCWPEKPDLEERCKSHQDGWNMPCGNNDELVNNESSGAFADCAAAWDVNGMQCDEIDHGGVRRIGI